MRYALMGAALLTAVVGLSACNDSNNQHDSTPVTPAVKKNVVFFLGDGYGIVPMTAARIYAVGESGDMVIDTFPESAFIKTFSNDAQVTDSAPSMSAYMTGVKMNNEVISMSPETDAQLHKPGKDATTGVSNSVNNCGTGNGSSVSTILELAKAAGKGVGAVTTARLTHATPATTYSHICHRDTEYDISRQAIPGGEGANAALGDGLDVMMGGISYFWRPYDAAARPKGRPDGRDLVAELQAKGYTFVTDRASLLAAASDKRVIGLFDQAESQGHMSYELDRDPVKEPSLTEMTLKAIDVLSKNANGYFLMVEGGRIDHALHATNAKRALEDTIAFDDAIKAALGKVDLSNTLIVVTADHDHTMAFNGYGKKGTSVLGLNISYATGAPSLDADGLPYSTLVFGNGPNRKDMRTSLTSATVEGNDYLQETVIRVGAGSESHGGGDVKLFATGAGSNTFKGTLDNTKVFGLLKSAYGF
jgi:alkaline phosphatase